MKYFVFAAVGIVIGFVLGGIGPRIELQTLQAKLDETRAELAQARQQARGGSRPSLPVPGMSEMFTPPPERDRPDRDDERDEPDNDPDADALPLADTGLIAEDIAPSPEDIAEEFDLAVDAQRLRAAQSRAALQEQADLSDADMVEFDNIIADMNDALSGYGDALMDIALSGEEPEAEEMLGLTHDVTGILYDTQTAVNDLVGGEAMETTDPAARQVWNHVDLEVFRDTVEGVQ